MSSAAANKGEALSAEECKGFFEQGTEAMVDHYTAIAACQSPEELGKLLKPYLKSTLSDLRLQEAVLEERLTSIYAMESSPEFPDINAFAQRKEATLVNLDREYEDLTYQITYVEEQLKAIATLTAEQLAENKVTANAFLSNRQKILDNWAANYTADPLMVINDIDLEPTAVTADGRDLASWVRDMVSKGLGGVE